MQEPEKQPPPEVSQEEQDIADRTPTSECPFSSTVETDKK